jgi:hypothetical protein
MMLEPGWFAVAERIHNWLGERGLQRADAGAHTSIRWAASALDIGRQAAILDPADHRRRHEHLVAGGRDARQIAALRPTGRQPGDHLVACGPVLDLIPVGVR